MARRHRRSVGMEVLAEVMDNPVTKRTLWTVALVGAGVVTAAGVYYVKKKRAAAAQKCSGVLTGCKKITDAATAEKALTAIEQQYSVNLNDQDDGVYCYSVSGTNYKFVANFGGTYNDDPDTPAGNSSFYTC